MGTPMKLSFSKCSPKKEKDIIKCAQDIRAWDIITRHTMCFKNTVEKICLHDWRTCFAFLRIKRWHNIFYIIIQNYFSFPTYEVDILSSHILNTQDSPNFIWLTYLVLYFISLSNRNNSVQTGAHIKTRVDNPVH